MPASWLALQAETGLDPLLNMRFFFDVTGELYGLTEIEEQLGDIRLLDEEKPEAGDLASIWTDEQDMETSE